MNLINNAGTVSVPGRDSDTGFPSCELTVRPNPIEATCHRDILGDICGTASWESAMHHAYSWGA